MSYETPVRVRIVSEFHYEKIKMVYFIWICMNSPKKRPNSITRYSIAVENLIGDVIEPQMNYALMTAIMICLDQSEIGPDIGGGKLRCSPRSLARLRNTNI